MVRLSRVEGDARYGDSALPSVLHLALELLLRMFILTIKYVGSLGFS